MLPIAQHIRGRTDPKDAEQDAPKDPVIDIIVIEQAPATYSVLMSATAFPAGTVYPTAEDAVTAAVKALNTVLAPTCLTSLTSAKVEEFVPNSRLAQLV